MSASSHDFDYVEEIEYWSGNPTISLIEGTFRCLHWVDTDLDEAQSGSARGARGPPGSSGTRRGKIDEPPEESGDDGNNGDYTSTSRISVERLGAVQPPPGLRGTADEQSIVLLCGNVPFSLRPFEVCEWMNMRTNVFRHTRVLHGKEPGYYLFLMALRPEITPRQANVLLREYRKKPFGNVLEKKPGSERNMPALHYVKEATILVSHNTQQPPASANCFGTPRLIKAPFVELFPSCIVDQRQVEQLLLPDPEPQQECMVCLESSDAITDLGGGVRITLLCGHSFHSLCLLRWLDQSCPICRFHQYPGSGMLGRGEDQASLQCEACAAGDDLSSLFASGAISTVAAAQGQARLDSTAALFQASSSRVYSDMDASAASSWSCSGISTPRESIELEMTGMPETDFQPVTSRRSRGGVGGGRRGGDLTIETSVSPPHHSAQTQPSTSAGGVRVVPKLSPGTTGDLALLGTTTGGLASSPPEQLSIRSRRGAGGDHTCREANDNAGGGGSGLLGVNLASTASGGTCSIGAAAPFFPPVLAPYSPRLFAQMATIDVQDVDNERSSPLLVNTRNVMICLVCGFCACEVHAQWHYEANRGHAYALDTQSQRVYDYSSRGYVHPFLEHYLFDDEEDNQHGSAQDDIPQRQTTAATAGDGVDQTKETTTAATTTAGAPLPSQLPELLEQQHSRVSKAVSPLASKASPLVANRLVRQKLGDSAHGDVLLESNRGGFQDPSVVVSRGKEGKGPSDPQEKDSSAQRQQVIVNPIAEFNQLLATQLEQQRLYFGDLLARKEQEMSEFRADCRRRLESQKKELEVAEENAKKKAETLAEVRGALEAKRTALEETKRKKATAEAALKQGGGGSSSSAASSPASPGDENSLVASILNQQASSSSSASPNHPAKKKTAKEKKNEEKALVKQLRQEIEELKMNLRMKNKFKKQKDLDKSNLLFTTSAP
ncbi:unnamed protein product [Amoebophrya sp. A25]|nr:unnamed protein product [Amoebophrya sp. A25]|eukprot:GSA25T00008780001.1